MEAACVLRLRQRPVVAAHWRDRCAGSHLGYGGGGKELPDREGYPVQSDRHEQFGPR
jgi:hypothetical protein